MAKEKRKYEVQHINRKTKALQSVEIPNSDLVAKYICMKTDNLQRIIDVMLEMVDAKDVPAGAKVKIIEQLIGRVLGPLAQQGISVETGEEGIRFQWISQGPQGQ